MRYALFFLLAAAAPATPRASDPKDAEAVIAKFKEKDPDLAGVFASASGYAVYPTVGKGAIGVGGAHGKGYVYEGGKLIGTSSLTQVTIGLQLGGQAYSEVVFLKDAAAMESFKRGKLKLQRAGDGGRADRAGRGGSRVPGWGRDRDDGEGRADVRGVGGRAEVLVQAHRRGLTATRRPRALASVTR